MTVIEHMFFHVFLPASCEQDQEAETDVGHDLRDTASILAKESSTQASCEYDEEVETDMKHELRNHIGADETDSVGKPGELLAANPLTRLEATEPTKDTNRKTYEGSSPAAAPLRQELADETTRPSSTGGLGHGDNVHPDAGARWMLPSTESASYKPRRHRKQSHYRSPERYCHQWPPGRQRERQYAPHDSRSERSKRGPHTGATVDGPD